MHYYKRHIGDYAKKAGHLTPLEHGVYNLIIDSYYDREQAPTLAEAMRWARARSEEEKAAVIAVLAEFFKMDGDQYRQNRIDEELSAYHKKAETNRQIALTREQERRDRLVNSSNMSDRRYVPREVDDFDAIGSPEQHDSCTDGQPNHKPITINQEKKSRERGERLPSDWHPTPEDTAFCKTERPDLRPSEVARRFYDYWIAVPGAKGRKLNWSSTWRNWVRNESQGKAGTESQPMKKDWL